MYGRRIKVKKKKWKWLYINLKGIIGGIRFLIKYGDIVRSVMIGKELWWSKNWKSLDKSRNRLNNLDYF